MITTPDISLVVPAYNEERLLPRLLDSVAVARAQYRGGPDTIEIVVSDNASTDSTSAIAYAAGCRVARVETRRIGAVRNGGAAIATGRVLAFTDADTVIRPETFNAVAGVMDDETCIGGATGWKFERNSWGLAATRFFVQVFVLKPLRVDGGVVFFRREAFEALGGYNATQDIAEDVEFLRRLRKYARPRGQRLQFGLSGVEAVVSTRKWDEHGDWHLFLMPFWPITKRLTKDQIVEKYWYPDER